MMDPPPYDDDDAMIADEFGFFEEEDREPQQPENVVQEEEPPMEVEEEFEQQQQPRHQEEDIPEDGSVPGSTVQPYRSDDEDAPSVRNEYSRKRQSPQKELFQFERYQNGGHWRDPASSGSPTTMKANSWKARKKPMISWDDKKASSVRASMAPDVQIMSFLKKDYTNIIRKTRMSKHSTVGKKSFPLTLADDSRIYVPLSEPKSSTTTGSGSRKVYHPLGTSFTSIMNRVKQHRRSEEREKLRMEAMSPTSAIASDVESQLWVDKHAPSSFSHLLSNERCNREVVRALREWDPYVFGRAPPKRPAYFQARMDADETQEVKVSDPRDKRPDETSRVILLSGPPGVGKTTLAHIAAAHVGYRPVEVNGSDERSEVALKQRVLRAMESTLSFHTKAKPNCIILDEIDGTDAASTIQSLVRIIREPIPVKGAKSKAEYLRRPIILICNNRYASTLKPLLPYAKHFAVSPPADTRLVARLRQILTIEKLSLMAGSSLLSQLVAISCGDIRSCLHTLQFTCAKARDDSESEDNVVDISHELKGILNGNGLKDERSDIATTVTTIFRKDKNASNKSVSAVLDVVDRFHDNSRVLDCLLTNLLRIPYIDPTLDRCAVAHEHLSSGDVIRQRRLTNQILPICGIIHLLCSVERRQDLVFNSKIFTEAAFQLETNSSLIQKFKNGMVLKKSLSSRSSDGLARDTVPYVLWVLSAGEGSGSLIRGTTSEKLFKTKELQSFTQHANTMAALGLTYLAEDNGNTSNFGHPFYRMEPPIDNLSFESLSVPRSALPSSLKELLSRKIKHCVLSAVNSELDDHEVATRLVEQNTAMKKRGKPAKTARSIETVALKKLKTTSANQNFLILGAKKAKAARHARNAARVGSQRTIQEKLSNTGSGKRLSEVVRLKFVKGFTQAVKIPCRMDEL